MKWEIEWMPPFRSESGRIAPQEGEDLFQRLRALHSPPAVDGLERGQQLAHAEREAGAPQVDEQLKRDLPRIKGRFRVGRLTPSGGLERAPDSGQQLAKGLHRTILPQPAGVLFT